MSKARNKDLSSLIIGVAILLLMVFSSSFIRLRADLTNEKRYTLTASTKELIGELNDMVFAKVYLSGALPADLERLSTSTRDLLDELRAFAGDNIQYTFIDPSASEDTKTRNEVYGQLQEAGLQYSTISIREKGALTEQIIFPGALITYQGKTIPLNILKATMRVPDAGMVNRSINNLEFEFANAIRQLTRSNKPRIAFLEGHGEADPLAVADLTKALEEQYVVERTRIDGKLDVLSHRPEGARYRVNKYELLIVAGPDSTFSEQDRFLIDQFIMNGGRMLWCLDAMNAHLDSLRVNQFSMATPRDLGLDNMLFSYGVRINKDLILDRSCAPIEIFTTPFGDQKKLERFPWFFEPVIIPRSAHPIVNNIDPVHMRFVNTMDTIGTDSVRKTILLRSSPYSKPLRNPVRISLNYVNMDPDFGSAESPGYPVAVLLEGSFRSAYAERFVPLYGDSVKKEIGFRSEGRKSAMLVVSDGDVMENRVDREKGMYFTLGYDRYAKGKVFGNREFLINAVNYLLNDKSLISIRSKSIDLRQLDPQEVQVSGARWKWAGMLVPAAIALLIGLLVSVFRKRKFGTT